MGILLPTTTPSGAASGVLPDTPQNESVCRGWGVALSLRLIPGVSVARPTWLSEALASFQSQSHTNAEVDSCNFGTPLCPFQWNAPATYHGCSIFC